MWFKDHKNYLKHLLEPEGPGPFPGTTESNSLGKMSDNLQFHKKV